MQYYSVDNSLPESLNAELFLNYVHTTPDEEVNEYELESIETDRDVPREYDSDTSGQSEIEFCQL